MCDQLVEGLINFAMFHFLIAGFSAAKMCYRPEHYIICSVSKILSHHMLHLLLW